MPDTPPTLSVIIPVFNERAALRPTLDEWLPVLANVDAQVIVVDDGSVDGTAEALTPQDGVLLVSHDRNRGYGAAIKSGLLHATGELVLMVDADGTYPASAFVPLWRHRAADMVIGARRREPDPLKALVKRAIFIAAGLVAGAAIPDLNTGLRLVKRSLLLRWQDALPDGFSTTTTLTMAALLERRSVVWVPIDYRPRIGRSKFHPLRDTSRLMRQVLVSRHRFRASGD